MKHSHSRSELQKIHISRPWAAMILLTFAIAVIMGLLFAFVPLVIEPLSAAAAASADTGVIRVEICGAVLHVSPDCSPERAAALAAALRKAL